MENPLNASEAEPVVQPVTEVVHKADADDDRIARINECLRSLPADHTLEDEQACQAM